MNWTITTINQQTNKREIDENLLYCCHKCFSDYSSKSETVIFRQRMILCSKCGNKRCPKATDHSLECTNSNAEGQLGSVYGIPYPEK